jgi:phosphoribosylformylglycinamidine cyclo-ligase
MPSVMRLFGALGGLEDDELRATFNGGLGMLAIVEPAARPSALAALARSGIESLVVGEVVETADLGGQRYTEGSLSSLTGRR